MTQPDPVVDFDDVLEGRVANGTVAFVGTEPVADLAARAGAAGWRLFHVDVSAATGKDDVLDAWRSAADFPGWFGGNWDALADSLSDLSWIHAAGYVVLFEGGVELSQNDQRSADTNSSIMDEATAHWADNGTPFVVLDRGRKPRAH